MSFGGLELVHAPTRVMAPRATSEVLVDACRASVGDRPARVVDVGSGAIAIALARACPRAEVWATDTNRAAVAVATANVRRHGLSGRVTVRQGDLLEPVAGAFDAVVANLPYLPASAATAYPDLAVEPFDAVFAAGDGLVHYRRLVNAAATRLAGDGMLLLQLDGRLIQASRAELARLRAAFAAPARNGRARATLLTSLAGAAAA